MNKQMLIRAIMSFRFSYPSDVLGKKLEQRKLGTRTLLGSMSSNSPDWDWQWSTYTLVRMTEAELLDLYNELEPQFKKIV